LQVVDWDAPRDLAPKLSLRFTPAGHILGASCVQLDVAGRRVLFTGDLGRPLHPVLTAPAPPPEADVVVCESTYGDRAHAEPEEAVAALGLAISRTLGRGGSVVIPAFAVDRTEVILHALRSLVRAGRLPGVPVYVDSPMALRALSVYRTAIAEGWREIRPELHGAEAPFDTGQLHELRSAADSHALEERDEPCVIVSASGMATGGRVLRHLAKHLPDPRSSVLLPGYQVPGTRGARLVAGERAVKMLGRYVPVRAEVVALDGFSVHADADEITAWLASGSTQPEMTFAVHGEPAAAKALVQRIDRELGWAAVVPRDGERVAM
jgi:metallo-beta-lactamase family protein